MTDTIRLSRIRGRIDFAVLAIREDEFEAVLQRFKPGTPVIDGKQLYQYSRFPRDDGSTVTLALARAWEQGQCVAQEVARDILEDLQPQWLILIGIAGAVPDGDFTLGDVLIANNVLDFTVTAALEGSRTELRTTGFQPHQDVARLLGYLPAIRDKLGAWNHPETLTMTKPAVDVPDNLSASCYYGSEPTRQRVRDVFRSHFPRDSEVRLPLFKIGTVGSSNALMKDTELLDHWKSAARQLSHVEMEAAGVARAAHNNKSGSARLLCIRGISDVVGFKRSDEWTRFACHVAASFFAALVKYTPDGFFRLSQDPRRTLPNIARRLPRKIRWAVRRSSLLLTGVMSWLASWTGPRSKRAPSVESIVDSFNTSSKMLVGYTVRSDQWLDRPELNEIERFIKDKPHSTLCVLGVPGSGKTTILATVVQRAIRSGEIVFAIKADMLPHDLPFEGWGSRELEFDITAIDAVRVVSTRKQVLVVVDQLDALASTVDLTSDRLDSILRFISKCASLPDVRVVCSCRNFDFNHDIRFRLLDAQTITLSLPEWSNVSNLLEKAGIANSSTWPQSFRDILRTPQHLKVFLDRFATTGKYDSFSSYHLMLDDLWNRALLTKAECKCLLDLTDELISSESISAPFAKFQTQAAEIRSLEAKQLLVVSNARIEFSHQTLLEHSKARSFTVSDRPFHEYVLARQTALYVRPTVWAVLQYLRDACPNRYRDELEALWSHRLRLHLQYLIIDFLGQVENPEEYEIAMLSTALNDVEQQKRVLIAIRGRKAWFDAFQAVAFPKIMTGSNESQWQMIGVLRDALKESRERCLDLIERCWIADSTKDELTLRVLDGLIDWDDRSVDLARVLARRVGRDRNFLIEELTYSISHSRPDLAATLVFDAIPKRLSGGQDRDPLENVQRWYELDSVAEKAPTAFLNAGWRWLVHACEEQYHASASTVLNQFEGRSHSLDNEDEQPLPPLLRAFCTAIDLCARNTPQAFLEITRPAWVSENGVVHQLISRGLCLVAESMPDIVLKYLQDDPRRLRIGSYADNHQGCSIKLVASVAKNSTNEQRNELEKLLRSTSMYRPGIELVPEQLEWDREARLRLLNAIPNELQSADLKRFFVVEESELPNWNYKGRKTKAGFVREIPPITKDEILRTSDDEVLSAIDASCQPNRNRNSERIEVDGGWEAPGGPFTAALEIAEVAKVDPSRAMGLAIALMKRGYESEVSVSIQPLGDGEAADVAVLSFIRQIIDIGVHSHELKSRLGYLLYRRCRNGVGLDDWFCSILQGWLSEKWDSTPLTVGDNQQSDDATDPQDVRSVIWSSRPGLLDTDQSLWLLLAITNGLLMRSTPAVSAWLGVVDQQLASICERTLKAFLSELRHYLLDPNAKQQGEQIIGKVFEHFPNLRTSTEGVSLVARITHLLSSEFLRSFFELLDSSTTYRGRQCFGELLALVAFRGSPHLWATEMLDSLLYASSDAPDDAVFVGIAFATANLWDELEIRDATSRVLSALARRATPRISEAMGTICFAIEDFANDSGTELFLLSLAANPASLRKFPFLDLCEHLTQLLPHNRILILRVCQALVSIKDSESSLIEAGPQLVNMAMTFQRFEDTRSEGLELFETFLKWGLDDVIVALNEIDIRPLPTHRRQHISRRRRRR